MSSNWKTTLFIWSNMKARGQKSQFSNFSVNCGKIWKCHPGFSKIPISHLFYELGKTLNLWMRWENLCPNLSFTVENKMENLHKRGWPHFRLKINDWDIPFPNILRVCQRIMKNIFHLGKWNEAIKLIRECVRLKIKV